MWLLVLLAACATEAEPDAAARAGLEQEVRAFLVEFRAAFASPEPDRIRALYVTDDRFRWLEDGETRYASVDDIIAGLAALPDGMSMETEYAEPRIVILSNGLAAVEAAFASTFGDPDAGGFAFEGVTSMLLERAGDGWRIVSGHTSSVRAGGWEG